MQTFNGFPEEMTDFLWELRFNNNREWFNQNRKRYMSLLKEPLDTFSSEMNEALSKKIGVPLYYSVSRINRDIRFSKNKEPYRDHKWVVFKKDSGKWKDRPVLFFEIGPDYYCVGMGIYETIPSYARAFRKKIDSNVPEFERLIKLYDGSNFELVGDMYKRKLADYPEYIMKWYQKKNMALEYNASIGNEVYTRKIFDICLEKLVYLLPMNEYMLSVSQ
jgi:uncharacterized protein (TIGR02453 family)